ncbi:recQ-mediated genome instability protein 1-like isoform X2 [Musa acuminata AAA Group]|uniref:recQ-mediated genome instability protein 1 isoform X2 n=1 Tax=Musa acuminata AAA Group TaxID=214697 RepID=UPI0031CE4DBF
MRRRYLRLPSSSDEDNDLRPQTLNDPNPNPPLDISDDDFVDVPDDLPPPSPRSAEAPPEDQGSAAAATVEMVEERAGSIGPIDEFLRKLGLRLLPDWLESCADRLMAAGSGFEGLDVAGMAKRCFDQFLLSDMNVSGAGVLPENVHLMHKIELEGPFVVQVDEIVNISAPLRERYHDTPAGCKRCLKLSITDGVQRVFGMEYRPIKELEVLAASGLKVVLRNVHIRRGLLLLVPEAFAILGGMADELDAARKRLVAEINKPPRGIRKHGNISSLTTRASLAAWPSDSISLGPQTTSTLQNSNEPQILNQVPELAISGTGIGGTITEGFVDPSIGRNNTEEFPTRDVRIVAAEESIACTEQNILKEAAYDSNWPDTEHILAHNSASDMEIACASDEEDAIGEVEHPLILSGDNEIPFTYLASLFAKWATQQDNKPCVQGRIKCFLTGVKGFQFKQRSTYELHVYVDDGSLISEVIIDHRVVQKGIGHSPEEVTSALSSTEKKTVSDMKDTLKTFQLFLAKFEGTMLLEMNRNSSLPVALAMKQGVSSSAPWLLLRRLAKTAAQSSQHNNLNPINLSP